MDVLRAASGLFSWTRAIVQLAGDERRITKSRQHCSWLLLTVHSSFPHVVRAPGLGDEKIIAIDSIGVVVPRRPRDASMSHGDI